MATITGEFQVCDCCALMIANGDESGCKDYYGHEHQAASLLGTGAVIAGDPVEHWGRYVWSCDGCGDDMLPGSNKWPVVELG